MSGEAPLSALEAGFLYAEAPSTPMHVGSLAIFDGAGWHSPNTGRLRIRSIRSHIARRVAEIPRLGQHPVWPPAASGRPRWIEDRSFDINRHVRYTRLPSGSTQHDLLEVVERLHMVLLDRDHPLWELWFVDGLGGGRVAMVEKIHHALVDGIGGVDLAVMLLDRSSSPLQRSTAKAPPPQRAPSQLSLLAEAGESLIKEPFLVGRDLVSAATHPRRAMRSIGHLASAVESLSGDFLAPSSSLNRGVGWSRRYRVIRLSLAETKEVGHLLGGKVNDVVLCAVTEGLRSLLIARGEDPKHSDLHALVPVSLRAGHEHRALGNRLAAMIVALPITVSEVTEQFAAVQAAVRSARQHHQVDLTAFLLNTAEYWPEPLIAGVGRLVHRQPFVNLVVTNIPGPTEALYLMGSRMLEVFPIVPLARNLDVSVSVLSYQGQLGVALWADRDRFEDLDVLVDGIEGGFSRLSGAARAKRAERSAS